MDAFRLWFSDQNTQARPPKFGIFGRFCGKYLLQACVICLEKDDRDELQEEKMITHKPCILFIMVLSV